VEFVIPKGVGDCEGQFNATAAFVVSMGSICQAESQIVKLLDLLQECGEENWVLMWSLGRVGVIWEHREDVK